MRLLWKGRYKYTEGNVRKHVLSKGGNYIILVLLNNGNYRPVYIGKTGNLRTRLLAHMLPKEPNRCIRKCFTDLFPYFRFCYVGTLEDRKNVEHTLYHHYRHRCNEKEPEGKIIDINFPF